MKDKDREQRRDKETIEPAPEPSATDAAVRDGAAGAAEDADAATRNVSVEEYEDLVRKAGERDAFRDQLLHERADFSNYQKRVLRDRPGIESQAVRKFAIDLLPVLDNFDRALAHEDADPQALREGVAMIREMLLNVMTRHGFQEIDALGQPFDPFLHEAVAHEESTEFPPDTVSEVLQKGYTQNGLVVRAAKVKVAKAPAGVGTPPGNEEEGA